MRSAFPRAAFLVLVLLLGNAAQGQGYQRPKPAAGGGPPTNADLVTYDGAARSVVVQIVNLTPYEITFKSSSITSTDETEMQNRDRNTAKAFMLAPVGLPKVIPAAPPEAFLDDPNYENTETRPYSMVFAWNDHKEYVTDNWVQWTVKGVESCSLSGTICTPYTQDVDLGLWMYRNQPPDPQKSKYLPETLKDVLKATFRVIGIIVDPASPAAWAREFLAVAEIGTDIAKFETQNAPPSGDGSKMFLASYVVPNPNSFCVLTNQGCKPSTMTPDETGTDAVYSLWPALNAGPCPAKADCPMVAAEGELVVSAHLLRGQWTPWCPEDPPGDGTNYVCKLGSLSVFMITIVRHDDFGAATLASAAPLTAPAGANTDKMRLFLLQAGAGRIHGLLQGHGRAGLVALRAAIRELSPAQHLLFRQMVLSMSSGRLPTKDERELVQSLAVALRARLK